MKKITALLMCAIMLISFNLTSVTLVHAEEIETVSVYEASVLDAGTTVRVEGLCVGVSYDGTAASREVLIKDSSTDTIISVRNVPYGAYPDFGYTKGDKLSFIATVKFDTNANNLNKKYLDFSADNGTIEETIISQGNEVTYNLDNVTTLSSWEDMQEYFEVGKVAHYSYVKITGTSYLNYYESSDLYRIHKKESAEAFADIKVDGTRTISLRNILMTNNVGSDWKNLFFEEEASGYPGTEIDKTFYAVYTGSSGSYYNLVILEEDWVCDNDDITYSNADIVKEIASAYDRQGSQILYDQSTSVIRRYLAASPEDATAQKTIYLDCSSYVNSCYLEAFGVNVMPVSVAETRPSTYSFTEYAKNNPGNVDVIGYWENADYVTDEEKQTLIDFVTESLQVGDVLTYRHLKSSGTTSGHVYIYVGNNTFMHCYGGGSYSKNSNNPALSYDNNAAEETSGQIGTISLSSIFEDTTHSRYIFKETEADTVVNFSLLRPFARGLTPTEEALSRMKIAGLSMEKTSSVFVNSAVHTGDVITYSVALENTNSTDIAGVILEDIIPEGTEFVSGSDGVSISGNNLTWTGDIPAGDTLTVTYDVCVTATAPGTLIKSDSTYVGGVKLGKIEHSVSAYSEMHSLMLAEKAKSYASEEISFDTPLSFVTTLYKSALGIDLFDYTTVEAVLDEVIDTENLTRHSSTELSKIIAPNLFGGIDIMEGNRVLSDNDRTRLISEQELAVGDIILAEYSGGNVVYVYVGDKTLITAEDGVCKSLTIGNNIYGADADNILISLFAYDRFAVLRPSMMDAIPTESIVSIEVTTPPVKLEYKNGEVFDTAGMVISAVSSNGETWEVTDYTISPAVLVYPENTVTVTYGDFSDTIDVTVSSDYRSVGVEEALLLDEENIVSVEGLYAGVADEGPSTDKEMLIKDSSSDAIIAVREIPYAAFPDYGYEKGDKLSFIATVKVDTSTTNPDKKYLVFSPDNGTIEETIVSKGNRVTYKLDNVVTVSSWADMKSLFAVGKIKHYTYIKFSGNSYMNYYAGSDRYRFHKNDSATGSAHVKPDTVHAISIGNELMSANIGSDWTDLFFDKQILGFPGTPTDKTFYAMYVGANSAYFNLVILDENWVHSPEDEVTVSVSVIGGNSVNINGKNKGSTATEQTHSGNVLEMSAVGDGEFMYWIDTRSNTILSYEENYTFTVGSDRSLAAIYAKDTDIFVTFTSMANKLVTSGISGSVEVPSVPYVYGYKFNSWYVKGGDKTSLKAGDVVEVTENTEFVAAFEKVDTKYQVAVNDEVSEYAYNEKVTLTAETEKDEKVFSYWKRDGMAVSYNTEYSFYVNGDTTVEAVYGESVSGGIVLAMANPVLVDGTKIAFFAERDIPAEYTLIESGILVGTSAGVNLDNASVKATAKSTANKGQYTIRKTGIVSGSTYYGVGYAIYRDANGSVVTAYSNEVSYTVE